MLAELDIGGVAERQAAPQNTAIAAMEQTFSSPTVDAIWIVGIYQDAGDSRQRKGARGLPMITAIVRLQDATPVKYRATIRLAGPGIDHVGLLGVQSKGTDR